MSDIENKRALTDAFRLLAKKLHPDKEGGDDDAMKALNILHDAAEDAWDPDTVEPAADVYVEVDDDGQPHADFRAQQSAVDGDDYIPLFLNGVEIPREAAAALRDLPKAEYDQWLADRDACLRDPLVLSRICGYDLVENPHRAMFDFILGKNIDPTAPFSQLAAASAAKRMLLWPRGCSKTFGVRIAECSFILRYPQIRICFLTGGEILGKRQLAALKNIFKKPTQEFLRLWPEFCLISVQDKKGNWHDEAADFGNAHEFSVPARGESIMPEPTFAISTARAVKSGSHFDLIVIDDLVNDSNWQTAPLLEKSYQDYLDITPLLSPSGLIIMTGTRYAPSDAYERVQETATKMAALGMPPVWDFSIRDCWSTDCVHCKHPTVFHPKDGPCTMLGCNCNGFASDGVQKCLFPVVTKANGEPFGHTIEYLQQVLAESGRQFFACQYLNKPEVSDGPAVFTQALIDAATVDSEHQLPPYSNSTTYLVFDQAYTGLDSGVKSASQRDESVIMVFLKSQGVHWIVWAESGRWSASQKIEHVLSALMRFRPINLYMQKDLNAESFQLNLLARAPEFGVNKVPIVFTDATNRPGAKNISIGNIENAMKGRRLKLYRNMPGYATLVAQLLKFPNYGRLDHDDYADVAGQIVSAPTGAIYDALPEQQRRPGGGPGNPCSLPASWLPSPPSDDDNNCMRICGSY